MVGKGRTYLLGMIAGSVATGTLLVTGFCNLWLLTQILPKAELGSYLFAVTLALVLTVFGTGGLDRSLLYRLSRGGAEAATPFVAGVLRRVFVTGLGVAVLLAAAGRLLDPLLALPSLGFWTLVAAPLVVTAATGRVFEAWLKAQQRVALALIVPVLGEVARTLGLVAALWLAPDEVGVAVAVLGAALVPMAVWFGAFGIDLARQAPLSPEDRLYARKSMLSLATLEATQRADLLLVGVLGGPVAAAHYAVASRSASLLRLGEATLGQVFTPRIGRLTAAPDGRFAREYDQARLAALLLAIAGAACLAVLGPALLALFGDYGASFAPALVLAAGIVVHMGFGSNFAYLAMTGRPGRTLAARGVLLIGLVALDLVLIPRLGALGAAIGHAVMLASTNGFVAWMIWRLDGLATVGSRVAAAIAVAAALLIWAAARPEMAPPAGAGLTLVAVALIASERRLWVGAFGRRLRRR